MKRLALIASTSLALLLGAYVQSAHAVPTTMSFTGKVQDSSGPVTGAVQVVVKIYDAAAVGTGTEVWTETHTVTADAGLVFLEFGSTVALDEGVFDGRDLWLDLTVNGDQQSPRMAFNTVPYATHAAVADTADTLGTLGPTDVALAGHNHAGTYLPVGATLSCGGSQKVTGLNSNGSVVCGADIDTSTSYTAGSGLTLSGTSFAANFGTSSTQVARGNHAHAGTYLPVGAALTCAGSQKLTGLNSNGSVICGADVDTNTTYSAGTGLTLSGTTISADTGYLQRRVATTCPAGQAMYTIASTGAAACRAFGNGDITGITTSGTSGIDGGCTSGTCALAVDPTEINGSTPIAHYQSLSSSQTPDNSTAWTTLATVKVIPAKPGLVALMANAMVSNTQASVSNRLANCYLGWTASSTGEPTGYGHALPVYVDNVGRTYIGIGVNAVLSAAGGSVTYYLRGRTSSAADQCRFYNTTAVAIFQAN